MILMFVMLIPLVDYITDTVNAIINITSSNTVDVSIGVAMLLNILVIPLILAILHLLNDERWNNRREYLVNQFGSERRYGAFVGLILFIFCPLICSRVS